MMRREGPSTFTERNSSSGNPICLKIEAK